MRMHYERDWKCGARCLLAAVALTWLGMGLTACASGRPQSPSAGGTPPATVAQAAVATSVATMALPTTTSLPPTPTQPPMATPTPSITAKTAATYTPTVIPTVPPATPSAAPSPTSLLSPTLVPPTATPVTSLTDQAQALVAFLNADSGNRAGLAQWIADRGLSPGQPPDYGETQRALTSPVEVNLDGDGDREIVLSLWQQAEGLLPQGMVLILDNVNGQYRIAYQADAVADVQDALYAPALLRVEDVNGDGAIEVVYTSTNCGAHTCYLTVWGVAWRGSTYDSIFAQPPSMAYPILSVADIDGDGKLEIVLKGGVIGSVGAGLQRERTEVYAWRNGQYALAATTYETSPYLYFKVIDANEALAKGDYAQAITLYRQALTDDKLLAWKPILADDKAKEAEIAQQEREGLRAFALFRLLQAQGLAGDTTAAQQSLADLRQRYPASALGEVADQYWKQFQSARDLAAACSAVQSIVEAHPEVLESLNGYGYANQDFSATDVCYQPSASS